MRLTTVDGVRLAGWHLPGPGELVFVLCPGFTGRVARPGVRRIAERLGRWGSVLAVDLRGHGASGGRSSLGDAEVLDLDAAVAWVRAAGYRRVASVGFSMGGSVVLRHGGLSASTSGHVPVHPVDAVVSVSSPSRWYFRGTAPMRRVHWLCETRLGRATSLTVLRTRLVPAWTAVPESPTEVVPRITVPLLLVHGDADPYFPPDHLAELAAAAPAAEAWLVPGFAHAEAAATPDLVDRIARWTTGTERPTP